MNDSQYEDLAWGPQHDPLYVIFPVTVIYVIILVTGCFGNLCTCVVIARNKHMHTATNYYLFSLAVSDLLMLFWGIPSEIIYIWHKYPYMFDETICIMVSFLSETSANATVLTITAFTVERYIAICHPFLSHTFSKLSRAIKIIIGIWVIALTFGYLQGIQYGILHGEDQYGHIINELSICGLKNIYIAYSFELSFMVFFAIPMTLIVIFYVLIGVRLHRSTISRNNNVTTPCNGREEAHHRSDHGKATRRVVKMLVAVVVAFFICWAPFQFQRLITRYMPYPDNSSLLTTMKVITYISGIMYYMSTTINPFLYNIMSLKFRAAFKDTLRRIVSRRDDRRLSGDLSASVGANAKLTYSALIRKSSKNHFLDSNNSFRSGISVDVLRDLSKRPLVVSFKKHKAENNVNSQARRDSLCDPKHQHCYKNNLELEYMMTEPRRDSIEETFCESEFTMGPVYDTDNHMVSLNMVNSINKKSHDEDTKLSKAKGLTTCEDAAESQRQKKLSRIRNLFRQCKNKSGQSYSCTNSSEVHDNLTGQEYVRKSNSVPCFSEKS
uniref:Neuropeptide receptor n=1 Tax=Diaphorina citri TaxID=121845 RepID=A0A2U9PFV7_DIACI|nr:neuropeptide receptor [Diaphorina citri]